MLLFCFFFFSSRRRHTRSLRDWSSDVCSSDLRPSRPDQLGSLARRGVTRMHLTRVGSNAPPLARPREKSGTQLGSSSLRPLGENQVTTLLLSQPQPPVPFRPGGAAGMLPQKPSVLA